jgi:hypothetical protein
MRCFAVDIGAADLYLSTEQYVTEMELVEGDTFALDSISVTSHTTYKVTDGVAIPQTVAFPEKANLPMEHK